MNQCRQCKKNLEYSWDYDSLFCPICNDWVEKSCDDENCRFCLNRPKKPSEIQKFILYVDYVGIEGVSNERDEI